MRVNKINERQYVADISQVKSRAEGWICLTLCLDGGSPRLPWKCQNALITATK